MDHRLGIRAKILILIMAATILPLVSLNVFWTISQRQSLLEGTRSRQALITQNHAARVNDFITQKVRALIIHSQSLSSQPGSLPRASLEIGTLLYQDKDLERVALVNQSGQEVVALTNDLKNVPLQNVKDDDPFKVVNYFAGNQYISPVSTDAEGHPVVTIAVPLVTFTTPQELGTLSTAEAGLVRNPQDIKGALIAQVSLENLWNSVLASAKTGNAGAAAEGYAYVVDDKGALIAHPDNSLANTHKDLSNVPIVSRFKRSLGSAKNVSESLQANSEKEIPVMATYQKIQATGWGVVFEEPMSNIYKNVDRVFYVGLLLSTIAIGVMALLSLWLSRFISRPILRIARVADRIGRGNFREHIDMRRRDEIGALSDSVNTMGDNLQAFIGRIQAQRQQLEVILNSTTDSILAIDAGGTIIIANEATERMCERSNETLVNANIKTVFPWIQAAKPHAVDYTLPGTHTYYDLQYTSPSGVIHYVNIIAVKTSDLSTSGQTIVTIHDETKSRELENMKVDFVSMAAHELRTPLSTIRGYLELIAYQRQETSEKVARYIAQARRSADALASLISNLLDVSRIERGTLVLTMEKVDLANSVGQAVKNLHFSADTKEITLTYTGPEQGYYIIGDSVAIREVIDNLIDNAIKYTPIRGHIEVALSKTKDSYTLTVTDNGIGIPANALPYLFTKFYRIDGGLGSGKDGTGLGLFISKSIVERHDGKITVQSSQGHGSTFTVTLPEFSEERLVQVQQHKGVANVNRRRGWTTKNIAR